MKNILFVLLTISLVCLVGFELAFGLPNGVSRRQAGILQIVENRDGQTSCWGLAVQLDRRTFKKTISRKQVDVSEAKHGRSLTDMMTWHVSPDGKQLIIKFKPGMGDFGTGNWVTVQIDCSAFTESCETPPGMIRYGGSITSDIL